MVGQNYGANKIERVQESFFTALKLGLLIMIGGSVTLLLFGKFVSSLFTNDLEVINISNDYLFMAAFLTFIYQFIHMSASAFQGLKKPYLSTIYTFLRLMVAPPIVFYLYSEYLGMGLKGIWWAIFSINVLAGALFYFHITKLIKKLQIIS